MNTNTRVFKVIIKEFISAKDKKKVFKTFTELLKEGGVTEFYFKYVIASDSEAKLRTSQRIKKLDLYNKEVYTTNERIKYKILNDISE